MKNVFKIVAWVFLGVMIIGFGFMMFLNKDLESTTNLEVNPVDLSMFADGDYEGHYDHGRFSNTVVVTIKDQKIVDIKFTETVEFDWPEVRIALIDAIIEKQNIDIDTISEATATSKAYLKSIEKALQP
ncbi:MAG: FMN-binding protein [Erysipelothrix sp.]|nr:FMN-binding protein [Erysipelothrix sp.]